MKMKVSTRNMSAKAHVTGPSNTLHLKVQHVANGSVEAPAYTGACTIVPKVQEAQILNTKGKRMPDNVVVEEVPILVTSTPGGGKTIYIGVK